MRKTRGFKSSLFSIFIIYTMVSLGIFGMFFIIDEKVSATNDPIQPPSGGTVTVNGNWTVTDSREYYNCIIVMNGNLSIMGTGMLTFYNVTLLMNNTENGTFNIEVLSGGGFHILDYDNDPSTIYDRSNITATNSDRHYNFWVRSGADFIMKNSELHEGGYEWSNYGLIIESSGFEIVNSYFSDNLVGISIFSVYGGTISNCIFFQNEITGISVSGSEYITMADNMIMNNRYGISIGSSSNNHVLGNNISFNDYLGIQLSYCGPNNLIGNYISYNLAYGIRIQGSSEIILIDNDMIQDGIYISGYGLADWNTHTIELSNTVNGKPVYYLKDQTSGSVSSDAGEVILANCNNIIVENNELLNADVGIELGFSSNNTIINNNISSNSAYGIYMINSDNNNITGNNISLNEGRGIYFDRCDYNQIFRNIFLSNVDYGIYFDICNYNIIMENTIFYSRSGIYIRDYSDYNNIIRNTVCYNEYGGIDITFYSDHNEVSLNNASYNRLGIIIDYNCNDNSILENTASFNKDHGIYITFESHRTQVIKNYLSSNRMGLFIRYSSTENQIIENQFLNNEDAIYLWIDVDNNNITRNIALNNERDIFLRSASYNRIHDNQFLYSNYTSIYLWGSAYGSIFNEFTENDILMCKRDGIFIRDSSNNNFNSNVITTLNGPGFRIWYNSDYNTLINNTVISENGYTIYVSYSENNTIYHNNFANKGVLAYDSTNNRNKWDNGYPSGGNYWSDYTGIDLKNGPSQNLPGSDGIGDTPYIIDADSRDNYPFTFYLDNYIFLHEGWNLISLPFIQPALDIDSVFSSITGFYDAVQYYDTTDSKDPWKHNHILKPSFLNDLNEVDHFKGIWIHITRPGGVRFRLQGTQPVTNQSVPIYKGWNLVGYPSTKKYDRTNGLNNIFFGADVDCIQWYDALTQKWHFMDSGDLFVPGRGYWVHSKIDALWEVPL
jgi:parallel beta-helix repeat protein